MLAYRTAWWIKFVCFTRRYLDFYIRPYDTVLCDPSQLNCETTRRISRMFYLFNRILQVKNLFLLLYRYLQCTYVHISYVYWGNDGCIFILCISVCFFYNLSYLHCLDVKNDYYYLKLNHKYFVHCKLNNNHFERHTFLHVWVNYSNMYVLKCTLLESMDIKHI